MTETVATNAAPRAERAPRGCAHTGPLPADADTTPQLLEEVWSASLRSKGRRVTKQRLAVLRAVQSHPHSNAEEIVTAVRQELPSITVQSVYVILTDLTDIDLLRKFEPPGTPGLYETRTGDNHHHAFCIRCGKVQDVDCATRASAPTAKPKKKHALLRHRNKQQRASAARCPSGGPPAQSSHGCSGTPAAPSKAPIPTGSCGTASPNSTRLRAPHRAIRQNREET